MRQIIMGVMCGLLCGAACLAQDCTGWLERTPAEHPPEVSGPLMAYDSIRGVTVLFRVLGPYDQSETWEWNGIAWSKRADGFGSGWRDGAMAFDSLRGVVVRFGGYYYVNDWDPEVLSEGLLEWDGVEWTERESDGIWPSARAWHAMSYDSARGVTVMFGGSADEGLLPPTWEWDGDHWTKHDADGPPQNQGNHVMAYDAARGVTVLFGLGKKTWEWDGDQWFLRGDMADSARTDAAMDFDTLRGQVVRFGGKPSGGNPPVNDTQAWDGQKWSVIPSDIKPLGRKGHGMAYDTARQVMVLFGGTPGGQSAYDDTWEFVCTPPCYPDIDENGDLDLFDYLAFVNLFNAADPEADCDESGALDLFDFLCFVNQFNTGCP